MQHILFFESQGTSQLGFIRGDVPSCFHGLWNRRLRQMNGAMQCVKSKPTLSIDLKVGLSSAQNTTRSSIGVLSARVSNIELRWSHVRGELTRLSYATGDWQFESLRQLCRAGNPVSFAILLLTLT